ncbi:ketopantoate reductase family protein [Pseudoalteromonas umbrosa]|uniref:ketopantoate reductase family protein n=1 Tax=Pseudoalteromonas umbrosa TaxID=3048489 RepID=UPI0024C252B8|nr:ketopantoate reductase family protein [Pseudoalteromonas sp. B95]MDK1289525.1 ketopantoate reductase family protein [Pseudoalteromonas sp. B95]
MSQVYILGCGAVGLLLAEKLAKDHSVTLVTRDLSYKAFLFIQGKEQTRLNIKVTTLAQLSEKMHTCIIPVKAYQVEQAISDVAPHLSDNANLILSHNGMHDLQRIQTQLAPKHALFFFSTSMGGMKPTPNSVIFKGAGLSQLGACNQIAKQRLNTVYQTWFAKHFDPIEVVDDINLVRWQKLCVNIAINPLTAIHQCKNGALRAPKYARQVLNLLNEACKVAGLEGVELQMSEELTRAYHVMTLTANNTSSMAQDIKLNRRSEIDAICGFVSTTAKTHGHQAPQNERLWQQIKQKEQV